MGFTLFTTICFYISAFFLGVTVANFSHLRKFKKLEREVQKNLDDFMKMNEGFQKKELEYLEHQKTRLLEIQRRKIHLN